jgi:hypothetical protein
VCSSAFADGGSGTRNARNDASAEYDVKDHSVQGAPPPAADARQVPLRGVGGDCWPFAEICRRGVLVIL